MIKRKFVPLLLLLLACAAACAPVVTHGPRVQSGISLYGTGGAATAVCDTLKCETELVPQVGAGIRYGRAATATTPGFSAGGTLSAALVSSEIDVYVQAPTSFTGLDVGAGLLSAATHTMPYVQAGRMRDDGSGWYATLGYATLAERSPHWHLVAQPSPGASEVRPVYWAPTVAYRVPGRSALHVYLSGAFGRATARTYPGDTSGVPITTRQPVGVVMVGLIFDLQPLLPPLRVPPPPRPVPGVPPPPVGQPR